VRTTTTQAKPAAAVIGNLHGRFVYGRRVQVLSHHFAEMIPRNASVLDVGCGDGLIAKLILARRPDLAIDGIDVTLRPKPHIPVKTFDGRTIPYPDTSFDIVSFVDVLHHTEDPGVLVREACRVARKAILIKDHNRDGVLSGPTLRLMDWVGNAPHGVVLTYNYWPRQRWRESIFRAEANSRGVSLQARALSGSGGMGA
jgi:SAM-dependent methyltransferase